MEAFLLNAGACQQAVGFCTAPNSCQLASFAMGSSIFVHILEPSVDRALSAHASTPPASHALHHSVAVHDPPAACLAKHWLTVVHSCCLLLLLLLLHRHCWCPLS